MEPQEKEDLEVIKTNNRLLALTEHPQWGVFVDIIEQDMNNLDSISSLMLAEKDRDALVREVEVRYHTIEAIRQYVALAIERAQTAQDEIEETKSDIINVVEP